MCPLHNTSAGDACCNPESRAGSSTGDRAISTSSGHEDMNNIASKYEPANKYNTTHKSDLVAKLNPAHSTETQTSKEFFSAQPRRSSQLPNSQLSGAKHRAVEAPENYPEDMSMLGMDSPRYEGESSTNQRPAAIAFNTTQPSSSQPAKSAIKKYFPEEKHGYPPESGQTAYLEDEDGRCWVPSPIPIFKKPLALSYNNFRKFYANVRGQSEETEDILELAGGMRLEASYQLMRELLEGYFDSGRFSVMRIYPRGPVFLDMTTGSGFSYVVVVDKMAQEKQNGVKKVVLVAMTCVASIFLRKAARTKLAILRFNEDFLADNGGICFNEENTAIPNDISLRMGNGHVIILGGKSSPLTPLFEFYHFDGRYLLPWFGETKLRPKVTNGTNKVHMNEEDADKVDAMFLGVQMCAMRDEVVMDTDIREAADKFFAADSERAENSISKETKILFPRFKKTGQTEQTA